MGWFTGSLTHWGALEAHGGGGFSSCLYGCGHRVRQELRRHIHRLLKPRRKPSRSEPILTFFLLLKAEAKASARRTERSRKSAYARWFRRLSRDLRNSPILNKKEENSGVGRVNLATPPRQAAPRVRHTDSNRLPDPNWNAKRRSISK